MPACNICKYAGRPIYKSPCSECKGFSKYEYEKIQTNADRIRAMSIDELNDFLRKVSDHDDNCPYEYGSVKSLEWLEKPYVQKEYKKI